MIKKEQEEKDFKGVVEKIVDVINPWLNLPIIPENIERMIYVKVIYWLVKMIKNKFKKKEKKEE